MNRINPGLLFGAAAVSLAYLFFSQSNNQKGKDLEQACSLSKLLAILEEMRIQYTPYYIHYYHMMVAL